MNASSSEARTGRQLVQHDAVGRGRLADLLGGEAGRPRASRPSATVDASRRGRRARSRSSAACGRADADEVPGGAAHELLDVDVGDQPAAPDHDQVVGGQRHLAHQVRGDEDRAALGRELLEQVADPLDPLGVEAVRRLVEDQVVRVARGAPRRCRGAGPSRARTSPTRLSRDLVEADQVDQLVARGFCGTPWVCASASRWL